MCVCVPKWNWIEWKNLLVVHIFVRIHIHLWLRVWVWVYTIQVCCWVWLALECGSQIHFRKWNAIEIGRNYEQYGTIVLLLRVWIHCYCIYPCESAGENPFRTITAVSIAHPLPSGWNLHQTIVYFYCYGFIILAWARYKPITRKFTAIISGLFLDAYWICMFLVFSGLAAIFKLHPIMDCRNWLRSHTHPKFQSAFNFRQHTRRNISIDEWRKLV